ncbi:MAG: AAC(3) family N-acetyltransferase [Kaiparowitsia implicata GSE-PSE-MK54-09C]|jgi:aminoglycoside 3-N-acetyltransferase|nr:AAC(3) family N-acetyltransferase [Kaiparowitsia implicata GSE-PSE-MK54-09C]
MISRSDIVAALIQAGIQRGMTVFSHANIAFFGRIEGAASMDDLIGIMLGAFADALGPHGTLVLPVFTYSFGSDKAEKVFDVQRSLSTTSAMGNWLLTSGRGVRSADPMLSVVAIGGKAAELTGNIDPICFGSDSIWARLHADDAVICNLNIDSGSTYLHWVERELGVPYRFDIPMAGTTIEHGESRPTEIVYTGRSLTDGGSEARFEAYHEACLAHGISRQVSLGRGQIIMQSARRAKSFLAEQMVHSPRLLTAGNLK